MKKEILFDFAVDKSNNTIKVRRLFDADVALVWSAWTVAEILEEWWAPRPWKAKTQSMDFREGGRWFYALVGPEGETHWCFMLYKKIVHQKYFTSTDAFGNEKGEITASFPSSNWETRFAEHDEATVVDVTISFDTLDHLEQTIQMGFKEGFTQGLEQLDEWLKSKKSKRNYNL